MKWKMVKLGDVCEIVGGTTPNTSNIDYWNGTTLWLSPSDLPEVGTITSVTDSSKKITDLAMKEVNLKLLPKGSVVYSTRASIGKIGIVDVPTTTNQGFTNFICSDSVHNLYLAYVLKMMTPSISKLSNSTTFAEVSKGNLKNLQIPLPPLPIQQKIAAILDEADALRRKDKALLAKYDELLQAVFYDMFGDPVKNEKGWEVKKVDELLSKTGDSTKCGPFGSALKKEEYENSGVPVWVMDNIVGCDFIENDCLFISTKKFEQLKGYEVRNGDIIVSRAGTVGKMAVVATKYQQSIISTNLIKISLNQDVLSPHYFVYLMKYYGEKLGRLKTGTDGAFTHMNTGVIKGLKIPLPPISEQKKFEQFLYIIQHQKSQIIQQQTHSEALFQSLMQRAFAGRLVG